MWGGQNRGVRQEGKSNKRNEIVRGSSWGTNGSLALRKKSGVDSLEQRIGTS